MAGASSILTGAAAPTVPRVTAPDPRAVRTLLDAYWSSEGWRPAPQLSRADLEHAVRAGVMVPGPSTASHDDVVGGVLEARARVTSQDAASCFLASLTSRRLDLRSALGSVVLARWLAPHAFQPGPGSLSGACTVCGLAEGAEIDDNVLAFERLKWGGVRRDDLTYVQLDLRRFAEADRPAPTAADRAALDQLLAALAAAAPGTTAASAAARPWPGIASNKAERQVLLELLGVCSVLRTPEHPGFLDRFVPAAERVVPEHKYAELAYPVCWWRSEHGIDRAAVSALGLG